VNGTAHALASPQQCTLAAVPCGLCGAEGGSVVATGRDYEYETTADLFTVRRCDRCGHHYLSPRPVTADLPLIYPAHYYSYDFIERMHPLARAAKRALDSRKIDGWLRESSSPSPRFLDVGCGEGWFLHLLHARGVEKARLWGVEIDRKIVQKLQRAGFQARSGLLEEIPDLPEDSFDLIVSLQVIEHVSDPAAMLETLARLLAPGGALILETPNLDSLDFRIFRGRYWGGYHFPRHWNFFTPASLSRLAAGAGLRVDRVRYLPAPTFWVYSLHHLVKYALGWKRVARCLEPFRNLPLLAGAIAFDRLRAALGFSTSNMQLVLRRQAR
jgi:2-polyprenyl-3-methyl-5-hydroxy-6-metoxy-1,4-benzoquinol methylase